MLKIGVKIANFPPQCSTRSAPLEASHANAQARAIAFFSYIWFKYILSLHCCKLCSVVVIMLSYQPPHPASIRGWFVNV